MSDLISREAAEVYLRESLFGAGCSVDQVEAALYCLRALVVVQNHTTEAPAVKVKPLEWQGKDPDFSQAGSLLGSATVCNSQNPSVKFVAMFAGSSDMHRGYTCLDAAKAAVQADYEARILAALEGGAA